MASMEALRSRVDLPGQLQEPFKLSLVLAELYQDACKDIGRLSRG